MTAKLTDMFGRTIGDVRLSVTDRCNFRCTYCIPEDYADWLPKSSILSFEEFARIVRVLHGFGVRTVRLTGGEPLLRRNLHLLVGMLRAIDDDLDISLTTNGVLLGAQSHALAEAGLNRVNVSLDTLRPERFAELTRRDALGDVLAGLSAAAQAGLGPVKVNAVAMRGVNDDEVIDLISWGRDHGYEVRFIEFMPLDGDHSWRREQVFSKAEMLDLIRPVFPFEDAGSDATEPARRFRFSDGSGYFGVIPSVTEPFCATCDRIRITADGMLRTCLFSVHEHDVRTMLRSGASDDDLAGMFHGAVLTKERGHDIGRAGFVQPARPMVSIGG